MKSTHCSTRRGASRGPNFFSYWTVSSKRWPNIPVDRWHACVRTARWWIHASMKILVWHGSPALEHLLIVTCCLATVVAVGAQLWVTIVVHWTGAAQSLIHPEPTLHQTHPFQFWHLNLLWDQPCIYKLVHTSNKQEQLMELRPTAADGGQCAATAVWLLMAGSASWWLIYSGLRTERHLIRCECEREVGHANMRPYLMLFLWFWEVCCCWIKFNIPLPLPCNTQVVNDNMVVNICLAILNFLKAILKHHNMNKWTNIKYIC